MGEALRRPAKRTEIKHVGKKRHRWHTIRFFFDKPIYAETSFSGNVVTVRILTDEGKRK